MVNRNAQYIKEFDVRSPVQLYPKQLYKVYGVHNSLKFTWLVGRTWKHFIGALRLNYSLDRHFLRLFPATYYVATCTTSR